MAGASERPMNVKNRESEAMDSDPGMDLILREDNDVVVAGESRTGEAMMKEAVERTHDLPRGGRTWQISKRKKVMKT